jgi:hypothetical protein
MRFISEDPLGFGGGDVNLHAYSLNSPTNLSDPNGTNPLLIGCAFGAVMDVSFNLYADYRTGRKSTVSDAFGMATLRYAADGCISGAIGAIFGEIFLKPLIEFAAPYVARIFADEAGAALRNAIGDAADGPQSWQEAEGWLNEQYGGQAQVRFNTSDGSRVVDNLTEEGVAQESKYGYQELDDRLSRQIVKDVELANTPTSGVNSVEWHFFESSISGVGPGPQLIQALQGAGIRIVIHLF